MRRMKLVDFYYPHRNIHTLPRNELEKQGCWETTELFHTSLLNQKASSNYFFGSVNKMYVYLDTAMRYNVIHILYTLFTENGRSITPFALNA